jgi:putative toxin-antitoxin system antitoxin component (TIGR02293 family)
MYVLSTEKVREQAIETFGDAALAERWLQRPTTALGGMKPVDRLVDEPGRRLVLDLLLRINHGLAS